MASILDFALDQWAKEVVRQARANAPGTSMAKSLQYRVRNGEVTFTVLEYGLYQDTGVRGSLRTIAKVGRWQKRAQQLGYVDRSFRYTNKRPPSSAFSKYSTNKGVQYTIARSIFEMGFPTTKGHLRWLQKPIENANKKFETVLADKLVEQIDERLFNFG